MKTIDTKKTTLELDAEPVAKLRAMLRALKTNITAEGMIEDFLDSMVSDPAISGFLQDSVHGEKWATRRDRDKINAKLERIAEGDRRLVRREPMARNAVLYGDTMERLDKIKTPLGSGTNGIANGLLAYALDQYEAGRIKWGPREDDQPQG